MGENKPKDSLHVRLKKNYSDLESDSICSICNDGGDILLCDGCPSAFHHACVGLEVLLIFHAYIVASLMLQHRSMTFSVIYFKTILLHGIVSFKLSFE
jgi:hypothetical protein